MVSTCLPMSQARISFVARGASHAPALLEEAKTQEAADDEAPDDDAADDDAADDDAADDETISSAA